MGRWKDLPEEYTQSEQGTGLGTWKQRNACDTDAQLPCNKQEASLHL